MIAPAELHRLIQQANDDLKKARADGDERDARYAERRMNALLDQL